MKADTTSEVQSSNLEVVTRFLKLLDDEGLAGVRAQAKVFWHPDMQWSPGMLSFGRETYRGWDEYREYLTEAQALHVEGSVLDWDEIVPRGDEMVLALGRVHYEDKEVGKPFESEYGLVLRVVEGRFRSGRSFLSHATAEKAVEAAGA